MCSKLYLKYMVALKASLVARTLERKLGALRSEGRKHIKFRIYDDTNTLVALTQMSRGWSDVEDNMISILARQLSIPRSFWLELCRCDHDRSAYLAEIS